jgi:agmatine deiminase
MEKVSKPINNHFMLPAEWSTHEATWLGWPHNKSDWPGKFSPIQWVYGEITRFLSEGEKVRIIVESKEHQKKAENILNSIKLNKTNIEFFILKTDRGWTRDSGPVFIKNQKEVAAVNFKFNAWAKYDNYKKDKKLPEFIAKKFNLKRYIPYFGDKHVILEGGSIDSNGSGTLITTEECLMDQQIQIRNDGFTKENYEKVFKNYLGIKNVLWLGKGIKGDDTHGHVDDLCRFVNQNTVVIVQENNPKDDNYPNLKENRERLEDMKLADGSKINVIELPMPSSVTFKNERLPASYANFYISNNYVLVPTFNDKNDRKALGILYDLFNDRKVVGIHAVDLVWGLGTIHCLTHEQPAL